MQNLFSVISMKDTHISSLQEKLKDLGGSYFPRKGRDLLEGFDVEEWRREQRALIRKEEMSVREVFERWGRMAEEEKMDWEDVVGGLVQGTKERVYSRWTEINFRE